MVRRYGGPADTVRMIDAEMDVGFAPEIFLDAEKFDGGELRRRCGSKTKTPGLPRGGVISGVGGDSTSIIPNN